jgi:hypothetical protein
MFTGQKADTAERNSFPANFFKKVGFFKNKRRLFVEVTVFYFGPCMLMFKALKC